MFKLNDQVLLALDGKSITGCVIGIDEYNLENFEGKKKKWLSYTLVSGTKGVFSRFWITDWKKDGWVIWTKAKEKKHINLKMVVSRSGIAKIKFIGDQGVSTPFCALSVFSVKKGTFYSLERFADSEIIFFSARKIAKPRIAK